MKKLILLCVLAWAGLTNTIKAGVPDDLKNQLDRSKSDTERVRHLVDAAEHIRQENLALAKEYTNKALELSAKTRYGRGMVTSYMYGAGHQF